MRELIRRLEHHTTRATLCALQPWTYGDIGVHYKRYLDGGSAFRQNYIPFLHDRSMPRQARIFEWCAGPTFTGVLADVNPDAVQACWRSIAADGLKDRFAVWDPHLN